MSVKVKQNNEYLFPDTAAIDRYNCYRDTDGAPDSTVFEAYVGNGYVPRLPQHS